MTIQLFLEHLIERKFDAIALKKEGLSEEFVSEMLSAFHPIRNGKTSNSTDILIKFSEEYDTQFSLISNISFRDSTEIHNNFILFGWHNGEDPIAVDTDTNKVVTLTYWDYSQINFECAENSDKFLQAFLLHGICTLDMQFPTVNEEIRYMQTQVELAIDAAGGDAYAPFWMSLYPISE